MKVLGIDTSTTNATLGIIEDDKMLCEMNFSGKNYNSEIVVDLIDESLKRWGFKIDDIDLISVGVGPGSFTGIRIAISIAKTISQAKNIEIVAVSSLKSQAINTDYRGTILVLEDARRENVFRSIISTKNDFKVLKEDEMIRLMDLVEEIKDFEEVLVLGKNIKAPLEFLEDLVNNIFTPNFSKDIRGTDVAFLGLKKYKESGAMALKEVLPNYLSLSQAQRDKK